MHGHPNGLYRVTTYHSSETHCMYENVRPENHDQQVRCSTIV